MAETVWVGHYVGVRKFDVNEPYDVHCTSSWCPYSKTLDQGTMKNVLEDESSARAGNLKVRPVYRIGQKYDFITFGVFILKDYPQFASLHNAPKAQVDSGRYPHKCPGCHKPAYIGFTAIEHEHTGTSSC